MFKHHNLQLSLFDVKLNTPNKDVILVKGNEYECESIPVDGSVKFSISQDIHVKKIKLNLIGEYTVEYVERLASGVVADQVYDRLCVMRVEWNNLLTNEIGNVKYGNYGDKFIRMSKLEDYLKKNGTKSGLKNGSKTESKNGSKNESKNGSKSGSKNGSKSGSRNGSRNGSSANLINEDQSSVQGPGPPGSGGSGGPPPVAKPKYERAKSVPALDFGDGFENTKVHLADSGVDGTPFKNHKASSGHSYLLRKGNYKLPFKCFLPGNCPETVESLRCGKLLYKFECSIERGRFEKALHKTKHIRIVRTLHPQNLNLTDTIDIDNTWPNKIQYNVSLNRKGVAVGSNIPVNLLLVPMIKGLELKGITGALVQYYQVSHQDGVSPNFEEVVAKQTMPLPKANSLGVDKWVVKSHFKVPSLLGEVAPTCELKNSIVLVKHRLRVSIQLKNQDGHVSELRANLPVYVYISSRIGNVAGRHYDISPHGYWIVDHSRVDVLFKKDIKHSKHSSSSNLPLPLDQDNQTPTEALGTNSLSRGDHDEEEEEEDDVENDADLDREDSAPPLYQQHMYDKVYDISSPQTPMEQLRSSLPTSMSNITSYFDLAPNTVLAKTVDNTPIGSPPFDVARLCRVPSYSQALDEEDESSDPAPVYENGDSPVPMAQSLSASFSSTPSSFQQHRTELSKSTSSTPMKLNLHLSNKVPKSLASSPSHSIGNLGQDQELSSPSLDGSSFNLGSRHSPAKGHHPRGSSISKMFHKKK